MTENHIAPLEDIKQTRVLLGALGRMGGIDVGTKTYGLALATADPLIVTPVKTLAKTKQAQDFIALQKFARENNVALWVIGLPLNMDSTAGSRVQAVKTVARNISRATSLPYVFEDERLSSHYAEGNLISSGIRAAKRKNLIDAHAAAVILESYAARAL
jgi:putative holliday junction resolvase